MTSIVQLEFIELLAYYLYYSNSLSINGNLDSVDWLTFILSKHSEICTNRDKKQVNMQDHNDYSKSNWNSSNN